MHSMALSKVNPNLVQNFGRRNLIINGAHTVDQRNGGASATVTNGSDHFIADRFRFTESSSATFTAQQVSDAPVGFEKSSKVTVTNTDTSLANSEFYRILHPIEGNNISHLNWGSANAKNLTLSFYVKSSLTGQFYISAFNAPANRTFMSGYTINAANTWEKKTIAMPGDTSGGWGTGSGAGIYLMWSLGTGSAYQATTLDSWFAGLGMSKSDQVNFGATNGATFQLTGVQLEVGDTATDFEHRSYGEELSLCHRYFEKFDYANTQFVDSIGYSNGSSTASCMLNYSTKRAAPTITLPPAGTSGGALAFLTGGGGYPSSIGTFTIQLPSTTAARIYGSSFGGYTIGQASALFASGSCSITIDAEL